MVSLIQHFEADFLWKASNPEFRNNPENFHPCISSKARGLNFGLSLHLHPFQGSYSMGKIQGLLKASPTVFKDLKLMENTELSVKILLQKC